MHDPIHAEQLLTQYSTDTLLHNQQVGQIMKYFAQQLWEDVNQRYITGLLHDIDRDHVGKDMHQHIGDEFIQIVNTLPYSDEFRANLIHDISTHYPSKTKLEPQTLIQKYLISVDELSGIMFAYSRLRWWFDGMESKWVIKRIKTPSFAAWVDREHVKYCEVYLDTPLEEFIGKMILAFQSFN